MIDFVAVGRKIAEFRINNKMTQDELADKLYVTRQALSKWENGSSAPSINILLTLAEIFNTTFDEILCLNDEDDIDPEDIFRGHSRPYVVNKLIRNEIDVNIADVFYLLSPSERMLVLKSIIDNETKVNMNELYVKLTASEQKYINEWRKK
jgi:transcriptional regulator with XRE-family HTH domain